MLEARSMYRAGNLIFAKDCDFDSYKELGLICPFCDQPVFLVKPAFKQRQKTGTTYYCQPHFSHYPGSDISDDDCEKRSRSTEGQQWLENIRIERRNQRLELFNLYFWEIIKSSNGYPKSPEKTIEKQIGVDQLFKIQSDIREWWNSHREEVYQLIDVAFDQLINKDVAKSQMHEMAKQVGYERASVAYLDRLAFSLTADHKLHKAIAYEAADFLGTRKAGIAFRKMIAIAIHDVSIHNKIHYVKYENITVHLISQLVNTRWIEELEGKKQSKSRGFGNE
jgi:hypothetical protein